MQTKVLILAAALTAVFTGCMDNGEPYVPENLNRLTVKAVYPDGVATKGGATVSIVEISSATQYSIKTKENGTAVTDIPMASTALT